MSRDRICQQRSLIAEDFAEVAPNMPEFTSLKLN